MLTLEIICIIIFSSRVAVLCYNCSVPDDWLGVVPRENVSNIQGNIILNKWPHGIVPYRLDKSLNKKDVRTVHAAMEEYQAKTCIRFVSHQKSHTSYVNIESDHSICGQANVCMQGGRQRARFGQNCRTKKVMIHQLGHSICLAHENQRLDRDKYLSFPGQLNVCASPIWTAIETSNRSKGLYDYSSQMHYPCGVCILPKDPSIFGCGDQVNEGLSVLDADYVNTLYDCQGCYRHRWIPIERFTEEDAANLHSFERLDWHQQKIYPCRAFWEGQLVVGTFKYEVRSCNLSYLVEHMLTEMFEVLTIPGDLEDSQSVYALREVHDEMTNHELDDIFQHAIPAGHLRDAGVHHRSDWEYGILYVGFAVIKDYLSVCNYDSSIPDKETVDVVGKVMRDGDGLTFWGPLCGQEIVRRSANILVCKRNYFTFTYSR